MAILKFKTLAFADKGKFIRVIFLKIFYFDLDKNLLKKISEFGIGKNFIEFKNINKDIAEKKFNFLITQGFNELTNSISGHKTIYIHRNSGIPLIGSNAFGIVDRNTNLVEVKPITSCNLNCIYCSVGEGKSSKKLVDYVVEEEYLVEELKKLIVLKDCDNHRNSQNEFLGCQEFVKQIPQHIEVHIGTQGEPLLYEPLFDLVKDISKIEQVKRISIDTNGTLLNKEVVDRLIDSGLTQFNLSINALDEKTAMAMAGCKYNVQGVIKIAEYIAKKSSLIITPVWLPGYNDKEIAKLVEFCKKLNCRIGIQNFLNYRHGRNPIKAMSWENFYGRIGSLEKKYNIKLILSEKDFSITKTKPLQKPFKKGEIVQAMVVAESRLGNEKLAVAKNRVITIASCNKKLNEKITLKITRSKHNIFYGKLIRARLLCP